MKHVAPEQMVPAALFPPGRELIVDFFAGGGGASTGIELALGRSPDIAVNHDAEAVAMHRINHPNTLHLQHDVWQVWPVLARLIGNHSVGLLWASPDCKHFSKAKGGKPVKRKIRDLAWVVVKFARTFRPRVIALENVEEFRDWGPLVQKADADGKPVVDILGNPVMVPCKARKGQTFQEWVAGLQRLGYRVEWRELRASLYGAPTIRKRLKVIARRDGLPIIWPAATHGDPKSARVISGELKPFRTAADCIDWMLPCHSIFLTKEEGRAVGVKRPLVHATMARIAKGVKRFVIDSPKPFIVSLTHQGGERTESVDDPFRTVTGAHRGEKALVTPFVTKFNTGAVGSAIDEPLPTVMANSFIKRPGGAPAMGLVAPILSTYYGKGEGDDVRASQVDEPLRTQTTENRHALVAPIITGCGGRMGQTEPRPADTPMQTLTAKADSIVVAPHLMTMRNAEKPFNEADKPTHTVTAGGARLHLVAAFLAQHNGGMVGHTAEEPLSTIVQKGSTQAVVSAGLINFKGSDLRQSSVEEPTLTKTSDSPQFGHVSAFFTEYYGTSIGSKLDDPMHTATTRDRFGLVTIMLDGKPVVMTDIGMRMLVSKELYAAQGFPKAYIIDRGIFIGKDGAPFEKKLTATAAIRMCGNSVCPPVAEALIAANCSFLKEERIAA